MNTKNTILKDLETKSRTLRTSRSLHKYDTTTRETVRALTKKPPVYTYLIIASTWTVKTILIPIRILV